MLHSRHLPITASAQISSLPTLSPQLLCQIYTDTASASATSLPWKHNIYVPLYLNSLSLWFWSVGYLCLSQNSHHLQHVRDKRKRHIITQLQPTVLDIMCINWRPLLTAASSVFHNKRQIMAGGDDSMHMTFLKWSAVHIMCIWLPSGSYAHMWARGWESLDRTDDYHYSLLDTYTQGVWFYLGTNDAIKRIILS